MREAYHSHFCSYLFGSEAKNVHNTRHHSFFSIMTTSQPQCFACNEGNFSKEDARRALQRDGSIIITGLQPSSSSSWSEIASLVPTVVWDQHELLVKNHSAAAVHVEHEALKLQGAALPPHSDGYIWGDRFPDLVILVCEKPADSDGGANFLIDGYAVLNRLSTSTRELLEKELVDHTERGENSYAQGAESIVPVIRYQDATGWRKARLENTIGGENVHGERNLCWRRMVSKDATEKISKAAPGEEPYISIWAAAPGTSESKSTEILAALMELDRAIAAEEKSSPRFALKEGEALIVDNFRMLHAREAFHGSENKRRMWRVWSWTNASFGLPPEVQAAGDDLPSNILQAEKAIQAKA